VSNNTMGLIYLHITFFAFCRSSVPTCRCALHHLGCFDELRRVDYLLVLVALGINMPYKYGSASEDREGFEGELYYMQVHHT